MSITAEEKQALIAEYRNSETDTGSPEIQVAVLTKRINNLQDHFTSNKKDHHSRRGLLKMVARRKSLLGYLQDQHIERYRVIIKRLGLRR